MILFTVPVLSKYSGSNDRICYSKEKWEKWSSAYDHEISIWEFFLSAITYLLLKFVWKNVRVFKKCNTEILFPLYKQICQEFVDVWIFLPFLLVGSMSWHVKKINIFMYERTKYKYTNINLWFIVFKFVLVHNFMCWSIWKLKYLKHTPGVSIFLVIIFHFIGSCTVAGEFVQGSKQELKI